MAKENGFASFTPDQAKIFIKEEEKKSSQDSFVGEQRHKQKAMNKHS